MHRRAGLGPQAHHPQRPLGFKQAALGAEHAHLHERRTIHPQHQAIAGRQTHGEEPGTAGIHLGGKHPGFHGLGLDRLNLHIGKALLRCGKPELAEGLRRNVGTGPARQQILGTARHQLAQHRRAQPLAHQSTLTALPIPLGEAAQAPANVERQLLNPGQPFLGQFVPNLAQGGVVEGIAGQAATPFRELGKQPRIHQFQEPSPIHLQGPQAIEQLLALVHFGRRQAAGQLQGGWGLGQHKLAPAQPQPTQGGSDQRRNHQGNHHRPHAPLGRFLPFVGAGAQGGG